MEKQRLVPGDPVLIENIVNYLKAKGIFDEFRHECLADVDTKSSCQNLSQRVDGYTTKFLSGEKWHPDLNKNELRNKLRRHIDESGMLAGGADHVVEQVINPKINQLFLPRIIEVVHQYLNEENEKLNKKKENSNDNATSEKPSAENTDGVNKTKSTKLDPIADILSFSYSKPQTNLQQNVQTKVIDASKTERKKDENLLQTKLSDALLKTEKKKEEPTTPVKVPDVVSKVKKEDTVLDATQNIEKDKEESISVKMESGEPATELASPVPAIQTKSQSDSKEPMKIKKEIKIEESETSSDPLKKPVKEDNKPEKKKGELEKKKEDSEKKKDDLKSSSDLSSLSEEGGLSKLTPSAPKSSNVVKNKSESEKSKKVKPHSSSKTSNDSQKFKTKDSEKVSCKLSDKHKTSSKVSKPSLKDHPSPHKSGGTSKSSKSDKTEDGNKNKSKYGHSKPPSSKSSSIKKESSSIKSKTSSDKTKTSKSLDLKPNIKTQTESSEKTSKVSLQYSSYDSSQGSDQDKSSTSSSHHKEKHKHFSKHHKKESNNKKSSDKLEKTPDKKRFQSDSDSGTPIKHKHMKHVSEKEKKKSMKIQESAKISSRSNSFGSTSSVSDSPSSSKETSASTSEETSDTSSKSSEAKKKLETKDKERCKRTEDFSPPPPPPPTSGISAPGSSSAEVSSMDETQSSQDSESDSKVSEDESSSESDVENLYSSNSLNHSNSESKLKTPEILNDVFDVFLYSSSSSEFEGYSSTSNPENVQTNMKQVYDVDVSSVHTSDLSSFDDFLSESDYSNSDVNEDRPTRRLTLKEAEKLLETKAKQRRLERSKNAMQAKHLLDDKNSITSPQVFTSTLLSGDESLPAPVEPKRESRRERKLNPKYASNEYASIFNSKKTSFITKQVNSTENVSPSASESDISPPKRRVSMGNLEANQLPSQDVKNSSCFEFSKRKLSFESADESVWTSETKTYFNSHERSINVILDESESHSPIALKIKKSVIKNDNEINKEPRPQGLKRKLDGNEKGDAKKLCRRNSDNSSSSESVPNENNPFNVKRNNLSSVFNMEHKNKDFFHMQKISNNGVVLKIEQKIKKKSLSKPNHAVEKQNSD